MDDELVQKKKPKKNKHEKKREKKNRNMNQGDGIVKSSEVTKTDTTKQSISTTATSCTSREEVVSKNDNNNNNNNNKRNNNNNNTMESRTGTDWYTPLHYISGSHIGKLELLKAQGIEPRRGKWNSEEVYQLHRNMMRFLEAHRGEIKDFRRLILPQTKEDLSFRKTTQFVLSLCHGIRRTRSTIRNRIEQQYTNFLKKGTLSAEKKSAKSD